MRCIACPSTLDWGSTGILHLDGLRFNDHCEQTASYPLMAHQSHFELEAISDALWILGLSTSTGIEPDRHWQ
ncbi:MAG TPA: hypothetical protein VIH55_00560 [Acidimicrobiia bacterium]